MSIEYDKYLEEHIGAVKKAANWMANNLTAFDELPRDEYKMLVHQVVIHDSSKRSPAEYGPYDNYFYGIGDEEEFNLAWLHHIHHNPHHWQHWLLVQDDGKSGDQSKVIALEMPRIDVLEMIADWWSFSWRSGNLSEVFDWYEKHKDGIILHERTRAYVERVLAEIRERMDAGQCPTT